MARYASIITSVFSAVCPYCLSHIENEHGSTDLVAGDDTQWDREAKVRYVVCQCGKRVNIGNKAEIV